jgi:hypothetical protein
MPYLRKVSEMFSELTLQCTAVKMRWCAVDGILYFCSPGLYTTLLPGTQVFFGLTMNQFECLLLQLFYAILSVGLI